MTRSQFIKVLILITCFPFIHSIALSSTIKVPKDYPTIQQAIDASTNGDTVLVDPGNYMENLDFKGKAIHLLSADGPKQTFIIGNQTVHVVCLLSKEGPDSILDGFTITNGKGGVYCSDSSPIIRNNIIISNLSRGISVRGYGYNPLIINNSISNHHSLHEGGGICVKYGAATIKYNDIFDNYAEDYGGGVMCAHNSQAHIEGNNIYNNSTNPNLYPGGGGIHSETGGSGILVLNNHIHHNVVGVYNDGMAEFKLIGNIISDNTGHIGGLLNENSGKLEVRDNLFFNNNSDYGTVQVYTSKDVIIANNLIYKNTAKENAGLWIDYYNSLAFSNNTIAYNSASVKGGGLSVKLNNTDLKIHNSIFWGNSAPIGKEIYAEGQYNGDLILQHSNVQGGLSSIHQTSSNLVNWGVGMITANPSFITPALNDLHLAYDSPCRDAGDNTAINLLTHDYEGDPRISKGVVDMGADEFHPHIYTIGHTSPGSSFHLRFVGYPSVNPVILWVGSGVLNPPISMPPFGEWRLQFPLTFAAQLGFLSNSKGVLGAPLFVPANMPSPISLPLQALVGDKLSNLCEILIQ